MARDPRSLVPRTFFQLPLTRFPTLFEDVEQELADITPANQGLSIYEDKKTLTVEAHLPGLKADDIDVTIDKGILWIRGDKKEEEEDKEKKFYRRATSSFSYRIALPSQIDEKGEPKTVFKDGILKLIFAKAPQAQTRKITVKGS